MCHRRKYFASTVISCVQKTLNIFSENCEDAFTRKGFDNWKKANEKFGEHEKSQHHREAFFKFQALQNLAFLHK